MPPFPAFSPPDRRISGQRGSRWWRVVWACVGAMIATAVDGAPRVLNEHEIKAAAFYNVLAFTNWPSEAFSSPEAPLVVAIVGQGPIETLLEKLVAGESWRGRRIVINRYLTPPVQKPAHVVFVARSQHANWEELRNQCANRPVLTVSDRPNFAIDGGGVQLAIEQNRLRILVNLSATKTSGLQLSSNLLHLAKIIGPMPDPVDDPHSDLRTLPLSGVLLSLAMVP